MNKGKKTKQKSKQRLTELDKMEIITMAKLGSTYREIAKHFDKSASTISNVINNFVPDDNPSEHVSTVLDVIDFKEISSNISTAIRNKHLSHIDDTLKKSHEALDAGIGFLTDTVLSIVDKKNQSAANVNMVINILKQLIPANLKSLEVTERIINNDNNHKIKLEELSIKSREVNVQEEAIKITIVNDLPVSDQDG